MKINILLNYLNVLPNLVFKKRLKGNSDEDINWTNSLINFSFKISQSIDTKIYSYKKY